MYTINDFDFIRKVNEFVNLSKNLYNPFAITLSLLQSTGIRSSELQSLNWELLDDNKFLLYTLKNSSPRIFEASELNEEFIDYLLNPSKKKLIINYTTLLYYLELLQKNYRFFLKDKNLLLHMFRHAYAKRLKLQGLTDIEIQLKMAEKNLKSAQHYIYSEIKYYYI